MAINNAVTPNQYTATSGQTVFAYTFEIFDEDDIKVQQKVLATGVTSTLTKGTHYTVSGVDNDAGGNVTLITGAATGDILTLSRNMTLERLTDYQNSGDFLASEVNKDMDRVWAAMQQVKGIADTGIRPTIDDPILNSGNTELAAPSVRAGTALGFGTTGLLDYISGTMPVGTLRNYATMAALVSDVANTVIGDRVYLDERSTGNGGGAWWKVVDATTVTENEFDIVTGDAARSFQLVFNGKISANQFGAVGDGLTDDTAAIQAAIDFAYTKNNSAVHFGAGVYLTTATIKIKQGVKLIGNGSQGSSQQYGTTLLVDHVGDGVHFAGSGPDYSGTGGGMLHWLILKENGRNGGQGILIDDDSAASAIKRHGEMLFEDILITANGTGDWQRALHVDGTAYTTSGSKGVRSIAVHKFRVTDCSQANEYILLDQVTHFTSTHLQVDQGGGSGSIGITVKGDTSNILFSNANINGDVTIGASTGPINGFVFSGRCVNFNNTNSNVDGLIMGQITGNITKGSAALNFVTSSESFLEKTTFNNASAIDDLVNLQNNGTSQGGIGLLSTTVITLKPHVSNGESWIYAVDGTTNERYLQVQYSRIRPSADNAMNLGHSTARWATGYINKLQLATGTSGVIISHGTGTPEGVVSADVGSTFHRTDGGASTSFYVKESGTGSTGWIAK